MAQGVFGVPITVQTLIATGVYEEPITQQDVANYAMMMINAGGTDIQAQNFVNNLKEQYGDGITAKCLIYNATGTTLRLDTHHDWHGSIYGTHYPQEIHNGQWAAFIHVHAFMAGTAGAVVYRSRRPYDNIHSCDWLFSWSMPFVGGSNRVYTAIREEGYFPNHWNDIYHTHLEYSGLNHAGGNYGYLSSTEIDEDTTAFARATFKLEN